MEGFCFDLFKAMLWKKIMKSGQTNIAMWKEAHEEKCQGCGKEEGTEKHRLYHCRVGRQSEARSQRN